MEGRKVISGLGYEYEVYSDGRMFIPQRTISFTKKDGVSVEYIKERRESKYRVQENGYVKCSYGLVHRAVAEAFLPPPKDSSYTVNHKDGDKTNNDYTNLEWIPHTDNVLHYVNSSKAFEDGKVHPIEVTSKDGSFNKVYRSKKEACDELGLWKSSVTEVVKGRLKSTGGYYIKEITKEQYNAKTKEQL